MQRNKAIDTIKGFAILIVMLGHCIVLNGLDAGDPYIYDAIKAVQMPLFMTVSGALAGISFAKKQYIFTSETDLLAFREGYLKSFGRTVSKRAVSYLVPFFSWFVLSFLAAHALDGTMRLGLLCEEGKALLFQTDRGLWFLMTLFVITFAVMLSQMLTDIILLEIVRRNIKKNTGKDKGKGIEKDETKQGNDAEHTKEEAVFPMSGRFILCSFFIGVCYLLFFLQGRSRFQFLSPSLTVQYMPFYGLGYLIYGYAAGLVNRLSEETGKMIAVTCRIIWWLFAAGFLFLVWNYDLTKAANGISELLQHMAASFLGTYVCYFGIYRLVGEREKRVAANAQGAERVSGSRHGRKQRGGFLAFIGRYTLEIYVLHFRFARLLGIGRMQLTFYSVSGILWLLASFALMSVCTAYCIYTFKKWRLLDFLLFGKRKAPASV